MASLAVIQSVPFFDKGKKKGFNLMMKDAAQFEPCATLGDSLAFKVTQISTAVKAVCRLYGIQNAAH